MLALADAAAQPVIQRDHDGERRQMAGAVIAGRPAGPCRLPGATKPRLHAGHRLAQFLVAAPAGAEAAIGVGVDRRIEDVRAAAAQRGLVEPQPLAHKILVKHVGAFDKAPQEFAALRRFEVEQKRPLAVVDKGMTSRRERVFRLRIVDLDDLGAVFG
jgi:hypothetical protein